MAQRPHASPVSKEKLKPKIDSKGRVENELTLLEILIG